LYFSVIKRENLITVWSREVGSLINSITVIDMVLLLLLLILLLCLLVLRRRLKELKKRMNRASFDALLNEAESEVDQLDCALRTGTDTSKEAPALSKLKETITQIKKAKGK